MREDIYGGLKNAIERGDSLDSAIKSFVNSGYDSAEVKGAADVLINEGRVQQNQDTMNQTSANINVPAPNQPQNKKSSSWPVQPSNPLPVNKPMKMPEKSGHISKGWIITLGVVLLMLVGFLVASVFFKDNIVSFFGG